MVARWILKMMRKKSLNNIDIERSFIFVSNDKKEDEKWTALKLTGVTGEYENIILEYSKVSFGDETEDGSLPLTFHYDIVYSPSYSEKDLQEDLDFKNLLGDILMHLIEKQVEDNDLQYVNTPND